MDNKNCFVLYLDCFNYRYCCISSRNAYLLGSDIYADTTIRTIEREKARTLEELAELTGEDLDSIKMKIDYLEHNGYLIKVKMFEDSKCNGKRSGCSGCTMNQDDVWIVKNDMVKG